MQVLQLNIQRSKTADHLMYQLAIDRGADILLLSDQYRDRRSPQWFSDPSRTEAIWILDAGKVPALANGAGDGFAWVRSRGLTFFSCYLTPSQPIADYHRMIDSLEDKVRNTPGLVVVAVNFNARAVEWGMPTTNTRGRYVLEMAARTNLHVLNVGDVSTFRRPGYGETIPDVSFASAGIINQISG